MEKEEAHELNPLNAELNRICHLLALLGAHHILHVSRIWVNVTLLPCTMTYSDVARRLNANVRGCRAHPMSGAFKVCIFPLRCSVSAVQEFYAQLDTGREMHSQLLVTGKLATISSRGNLRLCISFRLYLDILP